MAADVATTLPDWSTTAANNSPAGSTAISTNLDDNLRQIQAVVRTLAASDSIASATTTDLSTKTATFISVTGTTTITALGTEEAGIYKWLVFAGALTFTHNATSLILPSGANITTAAGDVACMLSLGSGNWRCLAYMKANGQPVATGVSIDALADAAAAGAIAMAAYAQTWTWAFTANDQLGLVLEGASAGGNRTGTYVAKIAATDADVGPLLVTFDGNTMIEADEDGALTLQSGTNATTTLAGFARTVSDTGIGGAILIGSGDGYSQIGGTVSIQSGGNANVGAGTMYAGSNIELTTSGAAGSTGSANGGDVVITMGDGAGASGEDGKFRVGVASQDIFLVAGEEEHLYVDGTGSPTINAGGGTGGTIAGQDNAFRVTIGTGSPTSVTVDFASEWATAPVAMAISSNSSANIYISSCTATQIVINFSSALAQNDIVHCICMGYTA